MVSFVSQVGRFPLEGDPVFNTGALIEPPISVCPNSDACKDCLPEEGHVANEQTGS